MMGDAPTASGSSTIERPEPQTFPNVLSIDPLRAPTPLREFAPPDLREAGEETHPPLYPERLLVDAYTIACNVAPGLDRAGAWVQCAHGPSCPNRACVARLYATETEARAAIPYFMFEQMRNTFKRFDSGREAAENLLATRGGQLPKYEILRVVGAFSGRDYRESGCRIENPFKQLAWGSATDPAWRRVRDHLKRFGIHGALLPPAASEHPPEEEPVASHSSLFLFLSGFEELTVTKEATIQGSIPR